MIERLNSTLKHYLPDTLKDQCTISSFSKGAMQITTSPAFATELRFLLPTLRDTFRKEAQLYRLSSIKLHIASPIPAAKTAAKDIARMSEKAKKLILDSVESIEDVALKNAVLKIIE